MGARRVKAGFCSPVRGSLDRCESFRAGWLVSFFYVQSGPAMSDRLVKAASAPRQGPPIATAENNTSGGATMGNGDSYVSRVAKYIPSEVLAFYVGANGLVLSLIHI